MDDAGTEPVPEESSSPCLGSKRRVVAANRRCRDVGTREVDGGELLNDTVLKVSGAGGLSRRLGPASWCVALLGLGSTFVLPGPPSGTPVRSALVITSAVFFLLLIARLLAAAAAYHARRLPLVLLAAGVGLWAAGSATVSASQTMTAVSFPAPGEVFFLSSYVAVAASLLLDVPRMMTTPSAVWLEAAVVCCAAVCCAAFAILTPLSGSFVRGGLPLLLAILYPLIDLFLGAIVLTQVMLRQRERSWRTTGLILGFLGLASADGSFIVSLSSDNYSSNVGLDALWGVSFALIVGATCARQTRVVQRIQRQQSGVLLLAAAVALLVLVMRPGGVIGWYVTAPAIVTLICTGARMLLALREAQGAAEAMRLSLTDELTGLPNRRALLAAADDALRDQSPLALMLLDLDGFKDINDSLGHSVGDEVLTLLGHRMRTALNPKVMVARLGGDEFALLAPITNELPLLEIAHEMRAVLKEPLRVDTIDLSIDASVGITIRAADDSSSTELLRRADIAMYEAKQARAGALLFDTSQDGYSRQRLRRGDDLRQALMDHQLVVWYQPQVDARTRDVVGVEALVRWQHPVEGLLSPIDFFADARKSGLMPALSEAVMRRVVADARRWADAGLTFTVAMNCAPQELLGAQFLPQLFHALETAELPPGRLQIEVTEDSFLSNPERARDALHELQSHDVQASIDDYGTGFSSLSYLRDLPVQELKIDRSFVSTVADNERSRMIVETTTQMAHALGLRLVAEGIEDAAAAAAVTALGVDVLQGYYFARPMPVTDVLPWVRRWSAGNTAVHLNTPPSVVSGIA